jgi:hypothetical protein
LALKKSVKQVRLWGTVLGSDRDYFVAEGLADGGDDGELAPDTEPRGTGVNKWCYWVTTSLTAEWTELPLVTPAHIRTSRKIKYLFTGDLKKVVLSNPLFGGTEAHLVLVPSLSSSAKLCASPPRAPSYLAECTP